MIKIPRHEQGTTRLFSLSMPEDKARALGDDPDQQQALLGVETLNSGGVEVFSLSDLGDLGLAGYLREGIDAQEEQLKRDRTKLSALSGWVMLVHSSAFGGQAVTLSPAPELTLIGTYSQTPADGDVIDLQAESAQPYTGEPDVTPAKAPDRRGKGSLVVAVLALLFIVVLWWAFF